MKVIGSKINLMAMGNTVLLRDIVMKVGGRMVLNGVMQKRILKMEELFKVSFKMDKKMVGGS